MNQHCWMESSQILRSCHQKKAPHAKIGTSRSQLGATVEPQSEMVEPHCRKATEVTLGMWSLEWVRPFNATCRSLKKEQKVLESIQQA